MGALGRHAGEEVEVPPHSTKPISAAQASDMVHRELVPILDEMKSIRRALVGAPEEGNTGILERLFATERRVRWLLWTIPIWVTAGTAGGSVLTRWLGL